MYALRRVVAFSLDASIVWLLIVGLSRVGVAAAAVNACVYLAYRGLGGALLPATLGRWILGLRLVSASRGAATVRQSLLRELPVSLVLLGPLMGTLVGPPAGLVLGLTILFSVGTLLLLLDLGLLIARTDGRTWRDLVAGTRVVRNG